MKIMANACEDVPLHRDLVQGAPIVWICPRSVLMRTMESVEGDSFGLDLDRCLRGVEEDEDSGHHHLEALAHSQGGNLDPQAPSKLPGMAMVAMLRPRESSTRTTNLVWKAEEMDHHHLLL